MSDQMLRRRARQIAVELHHLRVDGGYDDDGAVNHPTPEVILRICRRIDPGFLYEIQERALFEGPVVKITDPESGKFCLIPPEEAPIKVELPGRKAYTFSVEVSLVQTVEVDADDEFAAHERAFALVEEMSIGDCDEVAISFRNLDDEDPDIGFSVN